ncbi:HD domain-containing protein [Sutcliffiella deserti]|uniref:HD domain-containing protein n=1 Tax=Sutcliffiella deserti TaxID=2875501 RepID=UPI001CBE4526|nr:HD domain-containing protein [Sutcliffiella deserti]
MNLIDKAIVVATRAHQDQYRKGTNIPYIVHPYSVGMILQKEDCAEDIICAGILHDTVEDTDVTLERIQEEFNENIARIVEGCSEPNKKETWEARKRQTIEHIKRVDIEIGYVICADKIHNLQSIREDIQIEGDKVWTRFKREKEYQEWYYYGIVASFHENEHMKNKPIFYNLEKLVNLVFS